MARLYYTDPTKYGRSCADCRKYAYDKDGHRAPDKTGKTEFILRGAREDPPCHECAKTVGMKFAERHWRFNPPDPPVWAYRCFSHFLRCRAVNWNTPHAGDPIVRRNAKIFEEVIDADERGRFMGFLGMLRGGK